MAVGVHAAENSDDGEWLRARERKSMAVGRQRARMCARYHSHPQADPSDQWGAASAARASVVRELVRPCRAVKRRARARSVERAAAARRTRRRPDRRA
eukprot:1104476-Pleurochrysis_carterae.AAC.2